MRDVYILKYNAIASNTWHDHTGKMNQQSENTLGVFVVQLSR